MWSDETFLMVLDMLNMERETKKLGDKKEMKLILLNSKLENLGKGRSDSVMLKLRTWNLKP